MFDRPHHQHIAKFLASLNADFLAQPGCYFGVGTAIVLSLNEYRESVVVDFLCSSKDGHRTLRNTITNASLGDRTYISQVERCVSNPSLLVLCKIATVLEVDMQELFNVPVLLNLVCT
ncbi:helix-turn-helix transcriptional regulator [Janthinobacterium sp. SUN128]|uniref:Helix-turn-helix transcriptional regulator n=1 Tax=Janthinobacterium lividum TaxID=29581 RepID=A0ABU0XT74_9BURK|nr:MULTISPECIES: helix-turn-helix transcriptional regulator [Janthinobacterium]MDO8035517.1 helix-turn-helix transcriptional regulator [Janthinobacterium sp. SUN128]MDQ4626712.1 helix-turn-helix transcriptional regulator [Janthinobacterium lividum]MDQ4674321.1 helix-turn-helix transcriptional regulator [Janthinobacterium lividum]MDQ4685052.1 helix-turn-helix transcriptional regulator [Janthinobacterium lividum]